MLVSKFMQSVSDMFNSWLNDEEIMYYVGSKEEIQKEFIKTIQGRIGSNFVVLTQEELSKKMNDYHNSMEWL